MIELPIQHRPARIDDALGMAELVNMAGEGLALYLWTHLATPGQSPWVLGQERARRESGAFSYRNTIVREDAGKTAAALIGYPLEDEPAPVDDVDLPPMFVPLQQLEDPAPGTWYVNVLATYPQFRGRGYAAQLPAIADDIAHDTGKRDLSIIVADATRARRLYERCGYREQARRAMVKEQWQHPGTDRVLLVK